MRDVTPGWFRHLTLSRKFFVAFGVLLALLGLTLTAGLFYLSKINSYVDRHQRITVPAVVTAAKMERLAFEMSFALHRFRLNPSTAAAAQTSATLQDLSGQLRHALELYRTSHAARTHPILFAMLTDHGQTALAAQEDRALDEIGAAVDTLATQWTRRLASPFDSAEDARLRESVESDTHFHRLTQSLQQLVDAHTRMAVEMKREGDRLVERARLLTLGLLLLLGLVIVGTYRLVTRQIARPLTDLAFTADRVARQDLSAAFAPWPSRDEVGALSRSLDIMLDTLRRRTRALERKTKELESFSYSVAHDLKSPLREIEGFSSLLEHRHGETLNPEARRFVTTIRASSLRLSALIDDLLRYARLEQQDLPQTTVPVRPLFERVLADQASAILSAGCRVAIDCPALTLQGDATSLRQAVANLVGNALKFSRDARPPEVQIGARQTAQETVLWVRDNGIGFEQQDAEKIFGLFERLHGSDAYEGTGVGLAIVKLVAEKHGGRVWADAAPGKGATFHLALPNQTGEESSVHSR